MTLIVDGITRADCYTRDEAARILGIASKTCGSLAAPSCGKLCVAPRALWDSEKAMLILKSSVHAYQRGRRPNSRWRH